MSGGSNARVLRCSACSAEIPVRTFKVGRIVCPSCGGGQALGTDLVVRLRDEAPSAAGEPEPTPKVGPRVHPVAIAMVALVLGGIAYLLLVW